MVRFLLAAGLTVSIVNVGLAQPTKTKTLGVLSEKDGVIASNVHTPGAKPWSVDVRTLRGGKQEGVRIVTLDNGKLRIELIPTRGMGILSVTAAAPKGADEFKLGWKSPVTEVVHPKHINLQLRGGLGWL